MSLGSNKSVCFLGLLFFLTLTLTCFNCLGDIFTLLCSL